MLGASTRLHRHFVMKATDSVKTAIGSGSEKAGTTISSKKTSHPEIVHFVSVSHSPVAAIRLEHQVPVRKSVKPSNLRNIGLHPLISPCAIFVDKITVFFTPYFKPKRHDSRHHIQIRKTQTEQISLRSHFFRPVRSSQLGRQTNGSIDS